MGGGELGAVVELGSGLEVELGSDPELEVMEGLDAVDERGIDAWFGWLFCFDVRLSSDLCRRFEPDVVRESDPIFAVEAPVKE